MINHVRSIVLRLLVAMSLPALALGGSIDFSPSISAAAVGDVIPVNIIATGLTDLYAFELDFSFNPTVLSVFSVTEGDLFGGSGVSFSSGEIDNGAGRVTFIGDSLAGPGPGLSVNGTLIHIVFSALSDGSSSIDLSNVIILDSSFNDITTGLGSGSVVVGGVPEPSTGLLLVIGLTAIFRSRTLRWKQKGAMPVSRR